MCLHHFALPSCPQCPQTHTHTQNTATDPTVCVNTHRLQVDGSFPCVYGRADLFGVGLESYPKLVVSERHRVFLSLMSLLLTYNNEARAAELRPPRTRCGQGCRLSLSFSPSLPGLWPVSQSSLVGLFQLPEHHTVPNRRAPSKRSRRLCA